MQHTERAKQPNQSLHMRHLLHSLQVQQNPIEKEYADISPARIEQRRQVVRLE